MSLIAVQQSTQHQLVAQANLMNVFFILDNSGSMSGSRWNTARAGVLQCIRDLGDVDFVHLLCFGHVLQLVKSGQKKDMNINSLFNSVDADGNCTKLYDAILQGGSAAVKAHLQLLQATQASNMGCHTHIIVLTDGSDNGSEKKASDVEEFLQLINTVRGVKITMAGVGLDSAARNVMTRFGNIGDSDIQFKNLNSASDISDLFEHVVLGIRQQKVLNVAQINLDGSGASVTRITNGNNGATMHRLANGSGGGGGGTRAIQNTPPPPPRREPEKKKGSKCIIS